MSLSVYPSIRLFVHPSLLAAPPASLPVQGWAPSSPARLSLSSLDEVTEASEALPTPDEKSLWMVNNNNNNNNNNNTIIITLMVAG